MIYTFISIQSILQIYMPSYRQSSSRMKHVSNATGDRSVCLCVCMFGPRASRELPGAFRDRPGDSRERPGSVLGASRSLSRVSGKVAGGNLGKPIVIKCKNKVALGSSIARKFTYRIALESSWYSNLRMN